MNRVLVCGDRMWNDFESIRLVIQDIKIKDGLDLVIEGEAEGADSLARVAAEQLTIPVQKYPALWNKYGKGADSIRNQQMIDEGHPTLVIAFHDNLKRNKGTADMIRRAIIHKIKVIHFYHELKQRIIE